MHNNLFTCMVHTLIDEDIAGNLVVFLGAPGA